MEINFSKENIEDIEFYKSLGIPTDDFVNGVIRWYKRCKMVEADEVIPKDFIDDLSYKDQLKNKLMEDICKQILSEGNYWTDEYELDNGNHRYTVVIDIIRQDYKEI